LSLEAKALEGESADAHLLKTKSDRKLRGEIIAGKNISAGTVAPAFPAGDIFKGRVIILETERETHMVTEDVFEKEVAGGLAFEAVPQNRPEHKISEFYTEEGQLARGVAMQPGTIPKGIVFHKVKARFLSFVESREEVLTPGHSKLLTPKHLSAQFRVSMADAVDSRLAAVRSDAAHQILSWGAWKVYMTERNAELVRKAREQASKEEPADAEPAQAARTIVGFGRLGQTMSKEPWAAVIEVEQPARTGGTKRKKKRANGSHPETPAGGRTTGKKLRRAVSLGADGLGSPRRDVGRGRASKRRAAAAGALHIDIGGLEKDGTASEAEDAAAAGASEAADKEYWSGPKDMNALFMKECQLGKNHTRTITPVIA
jgi:hypothetical protein